MDRSKMITDLLDMNQKLREQLEAQKKLYASERKYLISRVESLEAERKFWKSWQQETMEELEKTKKQDQTILTVTIQEESSVTEDPELEMTDSQKMDAMLRKWEQKMKAKTMLRNAMMKAQEDMTEIMNILEKNTYSSESGHAQHTARVQNAADHTHQDTQHPEQ